MRHIPMITDPRSQVQRWSRRRAPHTTVTDAPSNRAERRGTETSIGAESWWGLTRRPRRKGRAGRYYRRLLARSASMRRR
jgi:hypothetical protein